MPRLRKQPPESALQLPTGAVFARQQAIRVRRVRDFRTLAVEQHTSAGAQGDRSQLTVSVMIRHAENCQAMAPHRESRQSKDEPGFPLAAASQPRTRQYP